MDGEGAVAEVEEECFWFGSVSCCMEWEWKGCTVVLEFGWDSTFAILKLRFESF